MADMVRSQSQSPLLADFSASATTKAVRKAARNNPMTTYPVVGGLLGGLVMLLFGASPVPLVVTIVCGLVGGGSWALNRFARSGALAAQYVKHLQGQLARHRESLLEELEKDLKEYSTCCAGMERYGEQGAEQFSQIKEKYDNLVGILERKLEPGELTYARYLGTAEQVYLAVLDNLRDAATLLQSVRTVDTAYIEERLVVLNKLERLSPSDKEEKETLASRRKLYEEQLEEVRTLLGKNEQAMTVIDATTVAIARIHTVRGEATVDMEAARVALAALAARAGTYSINNRLEEMS